MRIGNYEVYFEHYTADEGENFKGVTACTVDGAGFYGNGTAFCSKSDNYDRVIGRKVAFADAIKGLSKLERSMLWEEYKKKIRVDEKRIPVPK